jgi:hypothetical protein
MKKKAEPKEAVALDKPYLDQNLKRYRDVTYAEYYVRVSYVRKVPQEKKAILE